MQQLPQYRHLLLLFSLFSSHSCTITTSQTVLRTVIYPQGIEETLRHHWTTSSKFLSFWGQFKVLAHVIVPAYLSDGINWSEYEVIFCKASAHHYHRGLKRPQGTVIGGSTAPGSLPPGPSRAQVDRRTSTCFRSCRLMLRKMTPRRHSPSIPIAMKWAWVYRLRSCDC